MKKSKWIAISTAAVLLAGGLFAVNSTAAEKQRPLRRQEGGRFAGRAREKLGLTDEQVSQIRSVLKADKDTIAGLLTRMHAARNDVREAIRASEASETSVRAAAAKVASVEADLAVERMKLFRQISPILTPEQRVKLGEIQMQVDQFVERAIHRSSEKTTE